MTTSTIPTNVTHTIEKLPENIGKLLAIKGQIVTLLTEKTCKTRKSVTDIISKSSRFQCRLGVNYDAMKAVIEKRESGELPKENAGLSWGQWLIFPYIITHNECYYFRCSTVNNNYIPEVHYFKNGIEITKDEAKAMCLASEFYEKEGDCFNIKVDNILELNGQPF